MIKKLLKIFSFILFVSFSAYYVYIFFFSLKQEEADKKNFVKDKNIVVALGSEPRTLDPRWATDANGMRITSLIFQSLIRLGPRFTVLPDLAKSWKYRNKTYTFIIDKNIKFSNGRKLKKEDIIFSFQEYGSEKSPFSSAFQIIQSVDISENQKELILKIHLKKDSAKFLIADLPVLKILPMKEALSAGRYFGKKLMGTGAFKLKSQSSSKIVLEARSDVPQIPKIEQVTFKIIRDDLTRFQKILNQEIDVAQSEIPFQMMDQFLKSKDQFQIFRGPSLSMTYLLINFKDSCLRHKDFRKALASTIDRSAIIQYKFKNFAQPATSILHPNHFFFNKEIQAPAYDLVQAKKLLTQFFDCQKEQISLKTSNSKSVMAYAKILVWQMKQADFKVRLESFEWGTFYGDLSSGRFQLALLNWVGVVDPDVYRLAFHSREQSPRGRNRGFYKNREVDRLLDQGNEVMDLQKRKKIYDHVQAIILADLAFVPLWYNQQFAVVRKGIDNYYLSEYGDFRYLMQIEK